MVRSEHIDARRVEHERYHILSHMDAAERQAIREAIAALPAEQREALLLAFLHGLSHQAIATRLQTPLGTIKARIRRALQALRNLDQTSEGLSVSISRLSTGLRINSAADDPAGLVISENMRTQILGIDQASRNSPGHWGSVKAGVSNTWPCTALITSPRVMAAGVRASR